MNVTTISLEMRVTVPPDVLMQELQGEAVLLNLKSGRYFGLDEVGTRMWTVLTETESIQSAYDVLQAEYEVEAEQLERDLRALTGQLAEHGLLEVQGG